MGQIFGPDNIPPVVKASATTLTLATTHMGKPTRVRVGGQQYVPAATITLNTATTGFNGLDTGSISNTNSLYYVYAVVSSGALGMICSLAAPSTGPAGFTSAYKLIGAFYSHYTSNQIGGMVTHEGTAVSDPIYFVPAAVNFTPNSSPYFGNFRRIGSNAIIEIQLNTNTTTTYTTSNWEFGTGPLTIDFNTFAVPGDDNHALGTAVGQFNDGSDGEYRTGTVKYKTTTTVEVRNAIGAASGAGTGWQKTTTGVADNLSNTHIGITFTIPVVGWKNTLLG